MQKAISPNATFHGLIAPMILMQRTKSIVAASMSLGIAFLCIAQNISGEPIIAFGTRINGPESSISDFRKWASRYVQEEHSSLGKAMRTEGVRLARERHRAMIELIATNPQKALQSRISPATRKRLPGEIQSELEEDVSGIGNFDVFCADPLPGDVITNSIRRYVHVNGRTYRAFVYGRRTFQTSKIGVPIHGIAIGDTFALDEHVLPALDANLNVQINEAPIHFSTRKQYDDAERLLESAENVLDPHPSASVVNIIGKSILGQPRTPNTPTPSGWTLGKKKLIVIRVDFSDLPGDPQGYSSADVQNICDTKIAPYYLASSYGLTSLSNTVTGLYRMPQSAAYYATNYATGQLFSDAEAAAGANYNLTQFDRIIVYFSSMTFLPGSQINWGGLSGVGSSQIWVNGIFNFEIVAHELGHTYGLYHANLWQVSDGNPVSSNGTSTEYRDDFDTMGGNYSNDTRTDFNPWFKSMLGWISTNQIQTISANGTYKLNRFDTSSASGVVALKIVKDATRNYWVSYRGNFTNNPSLQSGAYINWGYNNNRQSDLIDTATPGSSDQDAGLKVTSSLIDPAANLSITTVDQGTTGHVQYLDVQVHYGNSIPAIYTEPQSINVTANEPALFQTQGSGIPLPIYKWQRKPSGATNWVNITNNSTYLGATTTVLTVTTVTAAMDSDQFQCILTNSAGAITTAPPAVLTVVPFGVSTLAGKSGTVGSTDGTGSAARFKLPAGIAVDGFGNLYVADRNNFTIRKVTQQGVVSTIAGLALNAGSTDGTNSNARFNRPSGMCIDSDGNLYVADTFNHLIRKITPAGTNWVVTTFAGQANTIGAVDSSATNSSFNNPYAISVDPSTNFFVADLGNHLIRKISRQPSGWEVTTLAHGSDSFVPYGICTDRYGNIFVANQYSIDQVLPGGTILTLAGSGGPGTRDGVGTNADFIDPYGLTADPFGNIYVTDGGNSTIRKVSPGAIVTTISGQPQVYGYADGALTNATFNTPWGIAMDNAGFLYVADNLNDEIRKLVISAPIPLPRLEGAMIYSNVFRVVLSGLVGSNYALQASSDLTNWSMHATVTMPRAGWDTITSPLDDTNSIRLFRSMVTGTNLLNQ